MAICPVGALSFGGKNPADSEPVGNWNGDELLRLIKSRRSVRFYNKQDIPQETMTKLIEMLSYPPTGGNRDNLHFSIIGTAEKMRAIEKITYDKISASGTPSPTMKFCLDNSRLRNCRPDNHYGIFGTLCAKFRLRDAVDGRGVDDSAGNSRSHGILRNSRRLFVGVCNVAGRAVNKISANSSTRASAF